MAAAVIYSLAERTLSLENDERFRFIDVNTLTAAAYGVDT